MDPRRVINFLPKFLGYFGGLSIFLIMVLTSFDVFFRYILNVPIVWVFEVSEYLMVACIFLGLAYTDTVGGHVSIDFIVPYFPSKIRIILNLFNQFFMFVFMVLFTWQGWVQFEDSWRLGRRSMGITQTPVAPSQFILFIGSFVFCLYLLNKIWHIIPQLSNKSEKGEK